MQSFLIQSIKEIRNNLRGKDWRIQNQVPYLKYREYEIFSEIFKNLCPLTILEWGAGFSTLKFPLFLDPPYRWLSVEHDENWYNQLIILNRNQNVEIILRKPDHFPYSDTHGDGSYDDFINYIEAPDDGTTYALIIIDGRARNDCLLKAGKIASRNGIIILHDANRERYRTYLDRFPYQALFTDYRRSAGGIWIGSKDRQLTDILDIHKHQRRWALVKNKIAKVLSV